MAAPPTAQRGAEPSGDGSYDGSVHRPSTHPPWAHRPSVDRARRVARVRVHGRAAAVVLLAIAALLGVGACTVGASPASSPAASSTSPLPAASSTPDPPAPSQAEVLELLERRAAALLAGERAPYVRTVADTSTASGARQLAAYSAARSLGVGRFEHGTVTVTPSPDGRSVRADAEVTYRLDGLDNTADRAARLAYELVPSATGWAVVDEEPVATAPAPPWVVMPTLRVVRTGHAVVAGTVPADRLDAHARVVDRALPALRRTWTGTPDQVLVLAPGTAAEADALLGRPPAPGGSPVAATTEGPTGPDGTASGDRVVLDPTAFARLTDAGRDVVLTHELAHVAVRSSVSGRPAPWLAEGYADHVGYARSDVPPERLLAPLLARARADGGQVELPGAGDLDPSGGDIEVPYLAAWQAVELLVERHGEDAVRRLVVAGSTQGSDEDVEAATDRALRETLRTSRAEVNRALQERLRALAG